MNIPTLSKPNNHKCRKQLQRWSIQLELYVTFSLLSLPFFIFMEKLDWRMETLLFLYIKYVSDRIDCGMYNSN